MDWSKDETTKNEKDRASVHYLMIPKPREDLINENIERSVSRMQRVVELGMISHKMSLLTIFGHKQFSCKNLTFFMKNFQSPLFLFHIWYEIANFEAKLLQK